MIKPELLKSSFKFSDFPPLPCPSCGSTLVPDEQSFQHRITARSNVIMDAMGNDPDHYEGVGAVFLKCSKGTCGESVICSGNVRMHNDNPYFGQEHNAVPTLTPTYFTPPIPIIHVSEKLPKLVGEALCDALALFWSNPSASGNALRVLIEALMDEERVVKSYRDGKGKRRMYGLHQRIELYRKKRPDLADQLLAIKFFGNEGSHLAGLKKESLIHAFRIVESVLEERFDDKSTELKKLVNKAIRKRGKL